MKSKPLFNKRLYKAQAGITISKEAKDVLQRKPSEPRSENNIHTLKCVVSGLKAIHKNFEFAKVALGHSITYEQYESDWEIVKEENETVMSCYYILSGSLEAFYKIKKDGLYEKEARISYTHVAGDYVGLVSADGARFDLTPPQSMATIENCEFIKIDRQMFHNKIQETQKQFQNEITSFLDKHQIFEKLNDEDRNKLISQLVKQEFPAGKQILSQGTKQEYAFFIAKGRCRYYRRIFFPDQQRSELFKMGYVEEGSYFDPSCILDDQASKFSVIAVGPVTCYLINKWTIKNSEGLLKALTTHRPLFHSDRVIDDSIKESDQWQSYKRDIVCNPLSLKNQSAKIVPKKCIPNTLSQAIRHGTALRRQRGQELSYHPQDGTDPLDEKLQAKPKTQNEQENGQVVLKAIMLMRRSRGGSMQKEIENKPELKFNIERDKKSSDTLLKTRKRYTRSAPKLQSKHTAGTPTKMVGSSQRRAATPPVASYSSKRNVVEESKAMINFHINHNDKCRVAPGKTAHVQEDRWVANEQKFVIKEVVNTRIPGKPYPGSPSYQRFGPSMFESLDKITSMEKEYKIGDPFGAKLAAEAWLKKVRANQRSYNPGPSPVIVIAELRDDGNNSDNENGTNIGINTGTNTAGTSTNSPHHDNKMFSNVKTSELLQHGTIKETKGHQGILEPLIEDENDEIAVEPKNEWKTAIHESRYESELCLEKAKKEIVEIEQQLLKLGWSHEQLVSMGVKKKKTRKHSNKISDNTIEENHEKMIEKEVEKNKRKRTLKRKDSIQNILEKQSSRSRLRRCKSGENITEKPVLTKHYSASSLESRKQSQGEQERAKTST